MKNDYRLGEWTVRPQHGSIEHGDDVVHLKPKVMAVLNCLAGAGGQVVKRDEVFEAVWPGQVVSDATLTQCVVELRQAFGDSAKKPKFIETIPKIGFRLIPAVEQLHADSGDAAEAKYAESDSAIKTFLAKPKLGVLAVLLVLLAVVIFVRLAPEAEEPSVGPESSKPSLAVLPFNYSGPDPQHEWIAESLTEKLTARLSRSKRLDVPGKILSFGLEDGEVDLEAVARDLGVDFVLTGRVVVNGEDIRLYFRMEEVASGEVLWLHEWPTVRMPPPEEFLSAQPDIVEALAWAVGITFDIVRMKGLTSNVQAYFLSQHADGLLRSIWKEGSAESMLLGINWYRGAVMLDPEFEIAWGGLAHWYAWAGLLRDDRVRYDWLALAAWAYEESLLLDPHNMGFPGLSVHQHTQKREWAQAGELLRQRPALHQVNNPYALYFRGLFLGHVGRARDALLAFQQSRRKDPEGSSATPFRNRFTARMYLLQGSSGDALAELEGAWEQDNMVRRLGSFDGVMAALALGERETILRWLDRAADHAHMDDKLWYLAMQEHLDDRQAALSRLQEWYGQTKGGLDDPFTDPFIMNFAAYFGDSELALDALRRSPDPLWFWNPLMKEVRSMPGFRAIARELGLLDYWREYGWGDFCRPASEDEFNCD